MLLDHIKTWMHVALFQIEQMDWKHSRLQSFTN